MLFSSLILASPADAMPREISASLEQGVRRFTLDNGMVVILKEEPAVPLATVQFWVGTGSSHEQEYLGAGLSHLIEHMIFKGTPTRGPAEITQTISDVGGMINAYTSLDRTVFYVDLPAEHWTVGFDVLADAIQNASFPEDEWQREKEVIIREMAMYRDNPDSEISRMLLETAYRVHPYRVPVIGHEDIFRKIDRDDILRFFKRHYSPDNMILVIAGGIDADRTEALVRRQFHGFERRARAPITLPREPAQLGERLTRRHGPHRVGRMEQSWHTVSLEHPDAPALDVLAIVTGSGRTGRLVSRIVEQAKLAHNIDAWSFAPAEPGLFGITAVFDPEREAELRQAINDEVASWSTSAFSAVEVEKASRMVLNRTLNDLQTVHGRARSLASGEFYTGSPLFLQTYLDRLDQVTPAALTEVARRYLAPERRTVALLMPETAAAARPEIRPAPVMPEARRTQLSGGLTLLTMEDSRLPLVNIVMTFNGGLRYEQEDNNGITSMLADLLTRGSQRRNAAQVAEIVDNRGASFTSFAGQNSFGLRIHCLKDDAAAMMELLSDSLINPGLAAGEVEKRRAIQLAQIAQQYESPLFLAQENLRQMLFPDHPYRFIPDGRPAAVEKITKADLAQWHRLLVVSGNAVLAVFGDITHDQALSLPQSREWLAPKQQTIIMQGFPGIRINDPRADALDMLQQIMSGLSSDLVINIRDKEGLAYFAGALHRPGVDPGIFAVYAGIEQPALARVQELMA
ncbi:MAG: M16 family metallopeptidase, partial [Kiritimatiellia bacterium]